MPSNACSLPTFQDNALTHDYGSASTSCPIDKSSTASRSTISRIVSNLNLNLPENHKDSTTTRIAKYAVRDDQSLPRSKDDAGGRMGGSSNAAHDEDAAAALATITRSHWTIPLAAALVGQCLAAAVAFIIIIVTTDLLVRNVTKALVYEKIELTLHQGYVYVYEPVNRLHSLMYEVRERNTVSTYVEGKLPCSTDDANFSASSTFLATAGMLMRSNPFLDSFFYFGKSNYNTESYLAADGVTTITSAVVSQCFVSGVEGITTAVGPVIHQATRPATLGEYVNLDGISHTVVTDSRPAFFQDFVLGSADVNLTFFLINEPKLALYLVATLPTLMNETSSITGETTTVPLADMATANATPDSEVSKRETIAAVGGRIDITILPPLLITVTPKTSGSHTTIYDLTQRRMIGTSLTITDGMPWYDEEEFALWRCGHTPSELLNEAYDVFLEPLGDLQRIVQGKLLTYEDRNRVYSAFPFVFGNGRQLVMLQSTPKKFYYGEIDKLETILIIVGIAGAALIVITCLVIGFSIRKSLIEVQENMVLASSFKNERVVPTGSIFTDIEQLCISLDKMNMKLMIAKAFMPQSLLVDSSETANDSEDDEEDEGPIQCANANRLRRGRITLHRQDLDPDASATSVSTQDEHLLKVPKVHHAVAVGGIQHKRVTILTMNVRKFHSVFIDRHSPSSVLAPTRDLTELIGAVATAEKGVIDAFHGDHFVLSFNAARHNAEGPLKAVRSALTIIDGVERLKAEKLNAKAAPKSTVSPSFSMGIATGHALVGHMGSATVKRMSIIGDVYSRAMALERICRRLPVVQSTVPVGPKPSHGFSGAATDNSPVQVLMDEAMAVEVEHTCRVQLVATMNCGALGSESFSPNKSDAQSDGPFNGMKADALLRGIRSNFPQSVIDAVEQLQTVTMLPEFDHFSLGSPPRLGSPLADAPSDGMLDGSARWICDSDALLNSNSNAVRHFTSGSRLPQLPMSVPSTSLQKAGATFEPIGLEMLYCPRSHEVCGENRKTGDEWMYELANDARPTVLAEINDALLEHLVTAAVMMEHRRRDFNQHASGDAGTIIIHVPCQQSPRPIAAGTAVLTPAATLATALSVIRLSSPLAVMDPICLEAYRHAEAIAEACASVEEGAEEAALALTRTPLQAADTLRHFVESQQQFRGILMQGGAR